MEFGLLVAAPALAEAQMNVTSWSAGHVLKLVEDGVVEIQTMGCLKKLCKWVGCCVKGSCRACVVHTLSLGSNLWQSYSSVCPVRSNWHQLVTALDPSSKLAIWNVLQLSFPVAYFVQVLPQVLNLCWHVHFWHEHFKQFWLVQCWCAMKECGWCKLTRYWISSIGCILQSLPMPDWTGRVTTIPARTGPCSRECVTALQFSSMEPDLEDDLLEETKYI